MNRDQLVTQLQQYQPYNEDERAHVERTLGFIMRHEDCFERSLLIGHVTASAFLLNRDMTHALLMHHTKLDRWFQLGGHCDGESNVLAVAIKEAQEESGIHAIVPVSEKIFDVDVHLIPERSGEPAHYHYDIRFMLMVESDEEVIQNRESKELRWIAKDGDIPGDSVSVSRMFEKWKNNSI